MQVFVLQANDLEILIRTIRAEGYRLLGPVARKNAVSCGEIGSCSDLYAGIADRPDLRPHSSRNAYFGRAAGLRAWIRSLQFPWRRVAQTHDGAGRHPITKIIEDPQPLAIIGIRSCELHAITESGTVAEAMGHWDGRAAHRSHDFFSVSVNCPPAKSDCVCNSVGSESGDEMAPPGDLVMTEVCDRHDHYFLIGSDSYRGAQVLQQLPVTPASEYQLELARKLAQPVAVTGEPDESSFGHLASRT
ncbi:hypothetical protein [Microbulbifer mangrovi]|uniref:hypothetical protein n=1 Tax=Microbulbifer mangrovi TaxID=927787 RepID=UPI0009905AC6|nr:hypothetical protein [Microbulbifer mangrovi]